MITRNEALKRSQCIPEHKRESFVDWALDTGYFEPKSCLYLDGYKDGSNTHSWRADLFFVGGTESKAGVVHMLPKNELPPLDTKLSHKQIVEYGFWDWLSRHAPKLDYYILREYGSRKGA